VYLTSETSTGVSIGEAGGSEGTGVGSLSIVSGLMNFLRTCCLGSDFDILEEFARALVLGLWGQGILLLLQVLVTIIDAEMTEKVFCREFKKINVSKTDFTKVAQSYGPDCNECFEPTHSPPSRQQLSLGCKGNFKWCVPTPSLSLS